MTELEIFGQLLGATMALMLWSLIYRENKFYTVAEHIAVGCFLGYTAYSSLDTLVKKSLMPVATRWPIDLTLAVMLGILIWTRVIPKVVWPSRMSLAVLAGTATAIAVEGAIAGQIVGQMRSVGGIVGADAMTTANNIIGVVATFTSLAFFLYTVPRGPILGAVSRVGRAFIMIAFGAILGTSVMSYMAFAIGQMPTLVSGYGMYVTVIAIVAVVADVILSRRKTKQISPEAK